MGMVVTQLVFASTLSGDCETLHNRRKVMVRQTGAYRLIVNGSCFIILARQGLHAVIHTYPCSRSANALIWDASPRQKFFSARRVHQLHWACYSAGDP